MSELIDELLLDAKERMRKSVQSTTTEFGSVRTGRASPALLDRIMVDYYGTETPLKQLATLSAPEAQLLTISPYDVSSIKSIEKSILDSDIGLTPNNDGKIIRLAIPPLSEDRRKQLAVMIRDKAEEARVAIRNVRRDANELLKEYEASGDITEDDAKNGTKKVQEAVDKGVASVDEVITKKEAEIMAV